MKNKLRLVDFTTFYVKRLSFLIASLVVAFTAKSQSIIDEVFVPIIDSNRLAVAYIKKSCLKNYQQPTPAYKIWAYDEKLNLVGYWQGTRKKFFKMKSKH